MSVTGLQMRRIQTVADLTANFYAQVLRQWRSFINWVCPTVCLIPRVIEFLKRQGCKGTLVVPAWPSAVFWTLLFPFDGHYLMWVKDISRL